MSGPGLVTLASLRIQSQERSDQLNSSFLSTSEWNRNIMGSYKSLYDLVVSAYGEDYKVTPPFTFQTDGINQLYPLPNGTFSFTDAKTGSSTIPPAFYKLLGVDLQISPGNIGSYVTIFGFMFGDRNRYAVPNFQSFYGVTNLRCRIQGDNLWFTPIPAAGQTIQIWQVPRPADIQPEVMCAVTASNTTVLCTDTSNLTNGMYIQAPGSLAMFPAGTTIGSIVANTSFVASNAPTVSGPTTLIRAWNDATTIDGVSGWEEYIVLDAALKAMGKEEDESQAMFQEKAEMKQRLIDMAENRNLGWPATVLDKQYSDFFQPGVGGSGFGTW